MALAACPRAISQTVILSSVDDISGETLRDFILTRGKPSDPSHACMAGCTIKCSNVFGGEDGKIIVSPLEYETIGLMGSNLGISSLDTIGRLNWEVNDLGLDSIEVGAALGVAAEAGLMEFGDGEKALELLEEIRKGTEVGRVLGDGAADTGEKYNVERVPVVKRQAMSRLRTARDQGHRRDLCHFAARRGPHLRPDHPRQDRSPGPEGTGGTLTRCAVQHGGL